MKNEQTDNWLEKTGVAFLYLLIFFSVVSIAGTQISLGFLFLIWIAICISTKSIVFHTAGIGKLLLIFAAIALISTFFSIDIHASFTNFKNILLFSVVFLIPSTIQNREQVQRLVKLLIIIATLMALYGLILYFAGAVSKARATQSITMTWGAMSVIFSLITVSVLLFGSTGKTRFWYGMAAAIQLLSLFLSMVRGAYIGVFAGLIIMFLIKARRKVTIVSVILLLLTMSTVLYISIKSTDSIIQKHIFSEKREIVPDKSQNFAEKIQNRLTSIIDLSSPTIQVRLYQWEDALEMFRDRPVLGFGWIDLGKIHRLYARPDDNLESDVFTIGHFHNNYIMILLYFGLIGFIWYLYLLVKILYIEYKTYSNIPYNQKFDNAIALGCLGAAAGFYANGFFDWTFGDAEAVTLFWISVGIAASLKKLYSE